MTTHVSVIESLNAYLAAHVKITFRPSTLAEALDLSTDFVRAQIRKGALRALKAEAGDKAAVIITVPDVLAWLESRHVANGKAASVAK